MKDMYIVSCLSPSPGIEARIPIVSGWAAVLQTSTVAQRWLESSFGTGVLAGFLAALALSGATESAAAKAAITARSRVRTPRNDSVATGIARRAFAQCGGILSYGRFWGHF